MNDDTILWDGFDEAIIGTITPFGGEETICYRHRDLIRILMERDAMTQEDAEDYVDHNIIGAWVGDRTPFILFDYEQVAE